MSDSVMMDNGKAKSRSTVWFPDHHDLPEMT